MLCMLLGQISSTATPCYMHCSKKFHQVNLLAIAHVYIGILLVITVLEVLYFFSNTIYLALSSRRP